MADARAVAEAGAFAVVVEGVVAPLAARITSTIRVPTIGIGASAECDGQILVTDDMMGMTFGHVPKFVRRYADLGGQHHGGGRGLRRGRPRAPFPGRGASLRREAEDRGGVSERRDRLRHRGAPLPSLGGWAIVRPHRAAPFSTIKIAATI